MKKINYLLSFAIMCMFSLQLHAVEVDTVFTEGFNDGTLPAGWVDNNTYKTASATNSNELYGSGGSIKLKQATAFIQTKEYLYADVFSFFCFFKDDVSADGILTLEKSTDGGTTWTVVDEFNLGFYCTIGEQTYIEFPIDEEAVMLKVSWAHETKGFYIDDFCLTQLPVEDNITEVASIDSAGLTVSYENVLFSEDANGYLVANDSIGYDAVFAPSLTLVDANASYETIRQADPVVGFSDTAIYTVTAADGTTKEDYKLIVARSHYQCMQGFFGDNQHDLTVGWSKASSGANLSSSAGDNGLFYGTRVGRIWNADTLGYIKTPKFSQVGSVTFSAKFSNTINETLFLEQSTDDGNTWFEVTRFSPEGDEFPSYEGENSEEIFGRQTVTINALDVRLQFRIEGDSSTFRTSIDDVAIKATDYVGDPSGLEFITTSGSSFKIYPNPASSYIQIQGDVSSVSIYSLTGRLVKQSSHENRINIQSLESGMYLVKADNNIKRLIVKK